MAFRMEVRSCRGVGREDDGADIFAGQSFELRPFVRMRIGIDYVSRG